MKKINRLILPFMIFVIPFLLNSCAMTKWQTVQEERPGGDYEFYKPEKNYLKTIGIESFYIDSYGELFFTIRAYEYSQKYKAPRIQIWQKQVRPADPVGAVMTTGLTLGMNVLFEPKKSGKQLIGESCCEKLVNSYIDYSKEQALNSYKWQLTDSTQITKLDLNFIIRGLHPYDVKITTPNSYTNLIVSRPIADLILSSPHSDVQNVELICVNCNIDKSFNDNSINTSLRTNLLSSINLGELKKNILTRRDEAQKEEKRQADLKSRQSVDSSVKSPTQRCLSVGLKQGSDDFIKCLKTLSK